MTLRDEFPDLRERVYLNSNSEGALPRGITAVLAEYTQDLLCWQADRWDTWLGRQAHYHATLERLIGAAAGTVTSDASSSVLLSRIASCVRFTPARPRIVITHREFPSAAFLLRALTRHGAELVVVDVDGEDPEARLCAAIDERTALVVASHAAFATGALLDLARLQPHCRAQGALLVVDAYQSIGTVPLDVTALDLDVVLGGAHKWLCGSPESAFVYVRPALIPTLEPSFTGWVASDAPFTFTDRHAFASDARRFAGGTPQILPASLSQVGLDLLLEVGIDAIRAHSLRCTELILAHADEAGLEVLGSRAPERRGGIVSLRFDGAEQVCERLVAENMICSHRRGLRIAPHIYNTLDEVDRFFAALRRLRQELS